MSKKRERKKLKQASVVTVVVIVVVVVVVVAAVIFVVIVDVASPSSLPTSTFIAGLVLKSAAISDSKSPKNLLCLLKPLNHS